MTEQPSRSDLYAVLGVARDAAQGHLDHAYRALVRRYHPDSRAITEPAQAVTDDTRLRQILAAYAVLGSPDRRADYDQHNPTPSPPARDRPIHVHKHRAADQPLLRAGPVHWYPSPATCEPPHASLPEMTTEG